MTTNLDRVRAYYAGFDEWERLAQPAGALEFRRARELLHAHLPAAARILDLGGGPGRYAIELARHGHRIVLADLSPSLLETARRRIADAGVAASIEAIDQVDARDLGQYPNGRFDAVVAFGPFYHLIAAAERSRAVCEIRRVLIDGGLVFASFIPRLSGIVGLIQRAALHPSQVPLGTFDRAAATGAFQNGAADGFQEGHFAVPAELRDLFTAAGFFVVETVSLRSIANLIEPVLANIEDPVRAEVDRVLDAVARDPAVVALGGHAVLVARKAS